ncbi:MAG TPA: alpha/beta hydrolase [Nocardioidaceae bacterium]|nr:alpha/beta hydrolase [Nocardioidaceae bacterium]
MPDAFVRRQLLIAALTGNALRPVPGSWPSIPAMFAGWMAGELAPHLLAATATDAVSELARGRRSRPGLALAAASSAGLVALIRQSQAAKGDVDRALREALGADYMDRLTAVHTDIDLTMPWQQLVMPFRMRDDEVEILKDVAYSEAGKRGLLDIYRKRDPNRDISQNAVAGRNGAPVLLHVHGGGWTIGDKEHQGIPLMLHMAARGWVCVTINYRLSPRNAFPAHLVDVKRAIAWVREHGHEYGADPSYIAITGGSAGGHLTALAALTPNDPEYQPGFEDADTRLQVAVPHYGVYDFAAASGTKRALQMRDGFLAPRVLQQDPLTALNEFERASPLLRVNAEAPPFFVIHGTHDTLIPVAEARSFVRRLRAVATQPVAYAELPGTQHAFDVFPSIRSAHVVRAVDRFLRWNYSAALTRQT